MELYDISAIRDASFLLSLENHYDSILGRIKNRDEWGWERVEFKVGWNMTKADSIDFGQHFPLI
jgi:hypothetical protein